MSVRTLMKKPATWLVLAGVLVLVIAGGMWCYKRCTDPQHVFWSTVRQSLSTSAVTVQVSQENNGSKAAQTAQYSFGANNISRSVTTLSQPGTVVRNESIGTPTADSTRYIGIQTDRKSASGKPLDFSQVMGVWAKAEVNAGGELFPQSALGTGLPLGGLVMPIGDLSDEKREKLLKQMQDDNLYQIAFEDVKKTKQDGRSVYIYQATIQPVAYAAMMKGFAQSVGIHILDQLDPQSFSGQTPFVIKMAVDVKSRHLVSATTEDDSLKQSYTSYDVPVGITPPKDTITVGQLQNRLTELQQ